jgi:phosphoribosylaminoimidazole carboxylase/phosphoribosylaminoimidazole-succinocarboxamide synthase
MKCGNVTIGRTHVDEMLAVTQLVFELLERAWQTLDHSLIDMKIEFGVTSDDQIVVADVIDNDSWRLWPSGDKRLMLDKQVYRNMDAASIDAAALEKVRSNFEIVADRTHNLFTGLLPRTEASTTVVGILMGSTSDEPFAQKIKAKLHSYGIHDVEIHVCSAHKSTRYSLDVLASLIQWPSCKVIVALAGRSNGLGPVAGANSPIPVINCPPSNDLSSIELDIWSSLRLPSGTACPTILGAENAAQCAAHIVANSNAFVWGKLRTQQAYAIVNMLHDDHKLQ